MAQGIWRSERVEYIDESNEHAIEIEKQFALSLPKETCLGSLVVFLNICDQPKLVSSCLLLV